MVIIVSVEQRCQPGQCTLCNPRRTLPPLGRRQRLSEDEFFASLLEQHGSAVAAYARALVSTSHLVEELVQETFIRAWKYLDSFRGIGCFEGWLLRICRNCAVDLRAQVDDVVSTSNEKFRYNDEPQIDVLSLMQTLPVVQREVLVLCGPLGYSYEAAAHILEIPVGTVRSRLARGRLSLRHLLAKAESA